MSRRPPDDLNKWSRRELVTEIERLRALTREMAERVGDDPRGQSTQDPIVGGSPHGRGDALLDARAAVLLDAVEVVLVDTKRSEPVSMLLSLGGRINYADDRVIHAYLFGPDGAAGIVSELTMLASRAGTHGGEHGTRFAQEFADALDQRLRDAP